MLLLVLLLIILCVFHSFLFPPFLAGGWGDLQVRAAKPLIYDKYVCHVLCCILTCRIYCFFSDWLNSTYQEHPQNCSKKQQIISKLTQFCEVAVFFISGSYLWGRINLNTIGTLLAFMFGKNHHTVVLMSTLMLSWHDTQYYICMKFL